MKYLKMVTLFLLFVKCDVPINQNNSNAENIRRELVGSWKSEILYVKKNSYKGTDSTSILDVNPSNYIEQTGLKSSIVKYNENGSYKELYIGPNDKVVYTQSGYWFVNGDTVIQAIYMPLKNQSVQRYHIAIDNNKGIFTSLMDYDGDGMEDDEFRGVSVRTD